MHYSSDLPGYPGDLDGRVHVDVAGLVLDQGYGPLLSAGTSFVGGTGEPENEIQHELDVIHTRMNGLFHSQS